VTHTSTGGVTTSYLYDALGRRTQCTSGSEVTRFLYSGHRVIEERDDIGAVLASYVYGRGLDEVVSMGCDVLDGAGAFSPDGTAEDYFYRPPADLRHLRHRVVPPPWDVPPPRSQDRRNASTRHRTCSNKR
tara:strand:- start:199 stop:591 length:393 start_codon:yes stop_codon:yes gene_type:complete